MKMFASYQHPTGDAKPRYVRQLFDQIAEHYDTTNQVISVGQWRHWQRGLAAQTRFKPGDHILDVACGTGDLTLLAAEQVGPSGTVIGIDFSQGMLEMARDRIKQSPHKETITIRWADALELPFAENSFDGASMGWAMRNMRSTPQALSEIYRVLKPGARFLCLDAAQPTNRCFRALFMGYWRTLLPAIDRFYLHTGDATMVHPYTYLSKSLDNYPLPGELKMLFQQAGYHQTEYKLLAFGAVAIHSGTK